LLVEGAAESPAASGAFAVDPRYHLIPNPAQPTARNKHSTQGSQLVPPVLPVPPSIRPVSRSSFTRSESVGWPFAVPAGSAVAFAGGRAGGVVTSGARTPRQSVSISVRSNAFGSAASWVVNPCIRAWTKEDTVSPDTCFASAAAGLAETCQWAAMPCRQSRYR